MPNFRQPDKTVSKAFVQNGVYVGRVTRVDEAGQQVYVEIARYVAGFEFGPLNVACSDLPRVDDFVACLFLENRQDDIMVIGVIKDDVTDVTVTPVVADSGNRPALPRVGTILYETDTEDVYVWTGTEWLTFFEVNLPATIYADLQGTAASATIAASAVYATSAGTALTVADNSVVLGNDTTGDYVATITAGTGVSFSAGSGTGEGSTPTLAIGQSVATSASPSFSTVTSTVATGTSPLTVASTTLVSNLNADLLDGQHGTIYAPTGMVVQFAAASSPTGWLLCDGSLVLKSLYPDLWTLLGSTYGTPTSTEFYLPDLRGRIAVGLDNMGGSDAGRLSVANTIGGTGGTEKHTLTTSEMPSHTHTQNSHTHTTAIKASGSEAATYGLTVSAAFQDRVMVTTGTTSTSTVTATNQNTGGDGAHNNMQPYILLNYIIKT